MGTPAATTGVSLMSTHDYDYALPACMSCCCRQMACARAASSRGRSWTWCWPACLREGCVCLTCDWLLVQAQQPASRQPLLPRQLAPRQEAHGAPTLSKFDNQYSRISHEVIAANIRPSLQLMVFWAITRCLPWHCLALKTKWRLTLPFCLL